MLGAGHQAAFQLCAAARVRSFEKVLGWNRHPERLSQLATVAADLGLPFEAVSLARLGAEADVIITITSSFAASLPDAYICPGTHLACMGSDTVGKQEVEPGLLARASVFTDEVAQSERIGEAQHAVALGLLEATAITPLGEVIIGRHRGRHGPDEITLFDGTGVGLQDLAVASQAVARAMMRGQALEMDI